jgi:hypothetical protein
MNVADSAPNPGGCVAVGGVEDVGTGVEVVVPGALELLVVPGPGNAGECRIELQDPASMKTAKAAEPQRRRDQIGFTPKLGVRQPGGSSGRARGL